MRIDFYHLEKSTLDQTLPVILEKAATTGKRVLVRTDMADRANYLNDLLWTYRPDSFLPHGVEKDGFVAEQPLFITQKSGINPNDASILVLVDGVGLEADDLGFERALYFFNGLDEEALAKARQQWKIAKDADTHQLFYWQQNADGKWEQKN